MYPLKKGKVASQAHVGLPEGTFEEEHGRKGFYGKSAHLYHAHPPTGWVRFEGKLRPHCFDLNQPRTARPPRCARAAGGVLREPRRQALRVAPRGAHAVLLSQRRWRRAVSSYIAAREPSKRISAPCRSSAATTSSCRAPSPTAWCRIPPIISSSSSQSRGEFDQPDKGLLGQHALYDPAAVVHARARATAGRQPRVGDPHQGGQTRSPRCSIPSIPWTWWAGRAT